jgi:hypothetical protein
MKLSTSPPPPPLRRSTQIYTQPNLPIPKCRFWRHALLLPATLNSIHYMHIDPFQMYITMETLSATLYWGRSADLFVGN